MPLKMAVTNEQVLLANFPVTWIRVMQARKARLWGVLDMGM